MEENLIENHSPFPMVKEILTETSSLRILKILPINLKEIVRSWIQLLDGDSVCVLYSKWNTAV